MRVILRYLVVALSCFFLTAHAVACELPAGTVVWLRLSTPVSSYFSKPHQTVHAILTEDLVCKNEGVALRSGTLVYGEVTAVKKVGWGIRHETASLTLKFDRMETADGIGFQSRVLEVENSRETVKNGVILGIRATDTPQGTINSRLKHLPTWNPYTDAFLIAYKATFPIFPEPEIWYGSGTDLRIELTQPLTIGVSAPNTPSVEAESKLAEASISQFPERVFTVDDKEADVINLAFVGTREQLQTAFVAAGWVGSDKLSKTSFFREVHAFLDHSGYATAPMRPMLLGRDLPQMTWQKSLNTYSKRDHLRIWLSRFTVDGEQVWLGAATHDDGATLSLRNKRFVHHIDPHIDNERTKVVRDLVIAGCTQSVTLIDRPEVSHHLWNATGDPVATDGKLVVVRVKDCSRPQPSNANARSYKAGNVAFRYLRREILTVRSDLWRANIIYGAYDLVRLLGRTAHSIERQPALSAKAPPEPAVVGSNVSEQVIRPENDDSYCGWATTYTPFLSNLTF